MSFISLSSSNKINFVIINSNGATYLFISLHISSKWNNNQPTSSMLTVCIIKAHVRFKIYTLKFRYKDHSKLRPSSQLVLRPLVSVPKYIIQCKWVLIRNFIHNEDHFRQAPLVVTVLFYSFKCMFLYITNIIYRKS